MRRLFYTLSIFSFFFVLGCQTDVTFHEIDGELFTIDKKGDVYHIDTRGSSIKKIKVETFIDPLPIELINDKITNTEIIDYDGLNFKVTVLLKYIGETSYYRVTITNNDSLLKWIDTHSYKRIKNDKGTLLTVLLVEEDRFTLKQIIIDTNRVERVTLIIDGDHTGFEFEGTVNLSKDLFSKITNIRLTTLIGDL